jgi:serine/threonine-protein kinase RsbW
MRSTAVTTQGRTERPDEIYEWPLAVALRLPAEPGSLPEVRSAVRGFLADLPLETTRRHAAEVAAAEAATNVVQYAYPPGESGPLEVEADFEQGSVELIVRDRGQGIQPGSSESLGVGLKLVAALADDFSITESDGGGVEIWMRFVCG